MHMITTAEYRVARLSQAEATAVLARNRIGRIAFTFQDRVDIEPVTYAFAPGVLSLRTTPGTKLEVLRRQPRVAFEVDEVGGPTDWRSVVVHGTVYLPDPGGSEADRVAHAESLRHLRLAYASALTGDDPWAFRTTVLRLHIARIEGRAAARVS